jgi:hypothetical protein
LGRLHGRQPALGEAGPVQVDDHPHQPPRRVGRKPQHLALQHRPQAQLLDDGTRPADRHRARHRVVVEVHQVIGQAGLGATTFGHLVVLAVGLALVGEQRTQRPGGSKPRQFGGAQVRP